MTRRVVSRAVLLAAAVSGCARPAPRLVQVEPAITAARPSCRDTGPRTPAGRAACDKEWSVLVYMMADAADLTSPALWNLHQMEGRLADPAASAASGRDADVVVELDVDHPDGIRRLQVVGGVSPFVPLRSLDDYAAADAGPPRSPVIESIDEARAEAPPATPGSRLAGFLAWGLARFPARHHAVIVWGHGFGFRPAGTDDHWREHETPRGGIALDRSDHSVLDIPALRDALAAASAAYLGGRPFDLYLSDACLMQTVEVDAELAGVARYLGGTEAKFTPLGLPYRLMLPELNGSARPPPASPRCAAQDAACRFVVQLPELVRSAVSPGSGLYADPEVASSARDELTYTVLDARRFADRAVPALHRLGAALLAYLREPPDQADRKDALRYLLAPHRPSATRPPAVHAFPGGGRDIGSLLFRIRTELVSAPGPTTPATAAVLRATADAEAALRDAVLAGVVGGRYDDPEYAGTLGLSVWLPIDAADYRAWRDWFAAARFYRAPQGAAGEADPWGGWLDELFTD